MSYDLMVFAPDIAPKKHAAFLQWYTQQTAWPEPHSYNDPVVSTPQLQNWFQEMILFFPAMNGPYAPKDFREDDPFLTDYSIGKTVIYAAFPWSKAEQAYDAMFRLAGKHGVGFFNVSSSQAEVWLPGKNGVLILAHKESRMVWLSELYHKVTRHRE